MAEPSVTLTMAIHLERPASMLLSRSGHINRAKSLSRNRITVRPLAGQWADSPDGFRLPIARVAMPRALAKAEGLI